MRLSYALILAGICLNGPAFAAGVVPCAGEVEIASARIARVERNGVFILDDGRAAILEGIRLPLAEDGAPQALTDKALRALQALAMAQPLSLTAMLPKQDRYDRIRVQAFSAISGNWLNAELLRQGLARVAIAPDRNECATELYEAEKRARDAGAGLWSLPALAIQKAASLPKGEGFRIVEGEVVTASLREGKLFLDFTADSGKGFAAVIPAEARKHFRAANPRPERLAGHLIRLRGMVEEIGGKPQIAIFNPAQIEFVR